MSLFFENFKNKKKVKKNKEKNFKSFKILEKVKAKKFEVSLKINFAVIFLKGVYWKFPNFLTYFFQFKPTIQTTALNFFALENFWKLKYFLKPACQFLKKIFEQ